MTKRKSKRGGKRIGAGAKKKSDVKIQVNLYVKESKILSLGGMEGTRNVCYSALDSVPVNMETAKV